MSYINYQMSDHEMWAVTLSAPCYWQKAASMELVAGLRRFPATKRRICSELMSDYSSYVVHVLPKEKFFAHAAYYAWILNFRFTSQYNDMRLHMMAAPKGPDSYIQSLSDPRQRKQAFLVAKTLFLLPAGGIQAFNIARAIYYIRCCLLLGNDHPRTAMAKIMEIARNAQQLYDSWEEYFAAFAVGEQFVSENPDANLSDLRLKELTQFMTSKQSAARYFPWSFRL